MAMRQRERAALVSPALNQGRWEIRSTLGNGEQLLLVVGIPVILILVGAWIPALGISPARDGIAAILSASLLACGFTSLAIATAFERRSAALTFLATTPLGKPGLLIGKTIAVAVVSGISVSVVVLTAWMVGWRPAAITAWQIAPIVLALALAGITFASWGFFIAGVLRAEAVLAVANAVFLGLVFVGGIAVPLQALPSPWRSVAEFLPTGALVTGIREPGNAMAIVALMVWACCGCVLATRYFQWDERRG